MGLRLFEQLKQCIAAVSASLKRTIEHSCAICGISIDITQPRLCDACLKVLPRVRSNQLQQLCLCCSEPIAAQTEHGRCGRCLRSPPAIDRLYSVYYYRAPIDRWITQFKFHQDLPLAKWFAEQLVQNLLPSATQNIDSLLAVPLHPARLRQRGFNQSELIAKQVAKMLALPAPRGRIQRIRATAAQSSLPRQRRRSNLRGAFKVQGPLGNHVVLIDDVYTTGSTVNEIARHLKRHGVQTVQAWVIAHATRKESPEASGST
ncbi:MAG: ComF family protein [Gammaproteobacteria bacterium]|nr:ComF family protein [Gammaproteobacteria bacterium]